MIIRWHGQSAYTLTGSEHTIAIDPFGPFPPEVAARITFDYPPIEPHPAHLLLVTHEHRDHNAVEAISGDLHLVRSTAGRFETPVGDVVAIASEHDDAAGTARGPNTIFAFTLDGVRIAHFGDFGQTGLRAEQRAAIGEVDLLFIPVGGGPTIGAAVAAEIVRDLAPAHAIPMTTAPRRSASSSRPTPSSRCSTMSSTSPGRNGRCPASAQPVLGWSCFSRPAPEPSGSVPIHVSPDLPVVDLLVVGGPLLAF
jgi:L-ascorbate metabolism protein UlaG (beta-lactamase superfamily)